MSYQILFAILAMVLSTAPNDQAASRPDLKELQSIGNDISRAMQQKDFRKALEYDFPELREEHLRDLDDTSTDLYCYVVGESCTGSVTYHPIYSQFKSMKKPSVAFRQIAPGGPAYLLIFFDAAKYTPEAVVRMSLLCKYANSGVPVWSFEWKDHRWKALHPVFDSEVDPLCSSPYELDK